MGQLGEPGLELFAVFGGECFRWFQEGHGIQHLYKGVGVYQAVGASFVVVVARCHLGIFQIGVHAGLFVEEPHAEQFRSLLCVALFSAEVPGEGKGGDTVGGGSQTVAVQLVQFGVRYAVAVDVGQSVGFGGVGPVVAGLAHVVVLVSAGRSLLLHHHGEGFGIQQTGGFGFQCLVGVGIERLVDGLLHALQVVGVPDGLGLCARHPEEEGKCPFGCFLFHGFMGFVISLFSVGGAGS